MKIDNPNIVDSTNGTSQSIALSTTSVNFSTSTAVTNQALNTNIQSFASIFSRYRRVETYDINEVPWVATSGGVPNSQVAFVRRPVSPPIEGEFGEVLQFYLYISIFPDNTTNLFSATLNLVPLSLTCDQFRMVGSLNAFVDNNFIQISEAVVRPKLIANTPFRGIEVYLRLTTSIAMKIAVTGTTIVYPIV